MAGNFFGGQFFGGGFFGANVTAATSAGGAGPYRLEYSGKDKRKKRQREALEDIEEIMARVRDDPFQVVKQGRKVKIVIPAYDDDEEAIELIMSLH